MATLIETTRDGRPLYRVRWNYRPRSIDGQPYDKREFRDRGAALAWKEAVEQSPVAAPGGRTRVIDVTHAYLHSDHFAQLEQSTRKDYESTIRCHINAGLGAEPVDRLTPKRVRKWQSELLATGFTHIGFSGKTRPARHVKVPTANKALRIARAVFKWAPLDDLPTTDAFQRVPSVKDRRPQDERKSVARPYSPQEIDTLVGACDTMIERAVILTTKDSGLRRTEVFALEWDCVDLDAGLIHVRRALNPDGSYKVPKTYEQRTVVVFEDGLAALKEWREHAPATSLVFPRIDGRPMNDSWERLHAGQYRDRTEGRVLTDGIRARSGIHLELGHLRDTYGQTLIALGASDIEITMNLGHESVETTRRHYAAQLAPLRESLRIRGNAALKQLAGLG